MPTTRSMRSLSTLISGSSTSIPSTPSRSSTKSKRKVQDEASKSPSPSTKKPRILPTNPPGSTGISDHLPAVLSFSFETAKQHLIGADARFEGVFNKLPCRPFEQLEKVDPFRTLVTSILGQQISWLAARSITHRFIRLYDPSLPEKPPPLDTNSAKSPQVFFPTASQVANTDTATLKSAGLSTRKAEYVQDLASRFADGRLTNEKLVEADDEELARLLIEVRGIGRWTVDMFAMFSLRRPDILPVGDLGVQRGVIRWFLALHSPSDPITISPKKSPKPPGDVSDKQDSSSQMNGASSTNPTLPKSLPSITLASEEPDVSSLPPVPATPVKAKASPPNTPSTSPDKAGLDTGSMPLLPEPFTPSIDKTLKAQSVPNPLPEGLTAASLKSRLSGKKIKGALLTPKEMEDLTEPWRPYRSLGVYYMWALAEDTS